MPTYEGLRLKILKCWRVGLADRNVFYGKRLY